MIIDREHCMSERSRLRENNDCTVRACAVAAQIDYRAMHKYLAEECDRKPGKGLHPEAYHGALESLGFRITRLSGPEYGYRAHWVGGYEAYRNGRTYWVEAGWRHRRYKKSDGKDYKSVTMTSLAKELPVGTYLVQTPGHVACLRDGEVHDFTSGRRHSVLSVHKVEED